MIIVCEFPNSCNETSLKCGDKTLLNSPISEFFVVTSTNVPPLKSIPKFNPLNDNKNTEITIKKIDK